MTLYNLLGFCQKSSQSQSTQKWCLAKDMVYIVLANIIMIMVYIAVIV